MVNIIFQNLILVGCFTLNSFYVLCFYCDLFHLLNKTSIEKASSFNACRQSLFLGCLSLATRFPLRKISSSHYHINFWFRKINKCDIHWGVPKFPSDIWYRCMLFFFSVERPKSSSWFIFVVCGACWLFLRCHNPPNSDMDCRIFIVRTDGNAWNRTQDTKRESALKVQWEENPFPHWRIEPASVAWQSDALSYWATSPSPLPNVQLRKKSSEHCIPRNKIA